MINNQAQILHSTFVDNYTRQGHWNSGAYIDIDGSFTLGYCLFLRSGLNGAPMVNNLTVGYKSTVNLPVQSAFFGGAEPQLKLKYNRLRIDFYIFIPNLFDSL